MNEAPLAPDCRHCGATNHTDASECWLCHRRDWRGTPKNRPGHPSRPRNGERATSVGCLSAMGSIAVLIAVIAMIWITVIAPGLRQGAQMAGLAIVILIAVVAALANALFILRTTLR
ncbi:MAG: hypothetical protein ACLQGP_27090 [Isosphaeraceae bacterium]